MSTQNFFKMRSDWARRKHLIVNYYLTPAIKKLRHASPDRRVFILDGFAGRGKYEEGTPGSPFYTGTLASNCREGDKPLDLFVRNVEPDTEYFRELELSTASWVRSGFVTNLNGAFQETLPQVLQEADQSPLFAFLDPFRHTQLEFNDLLPLLSRPAKTEVCAVFFTRMVQRNLQALRPDAKSSAEFRSKMSSTITQVFGGDGWKVLVAENRLSYDDILGYLSQQVLSNARLGYSGESGYVRWTPIFARKDSERVKRQLQYHVVFWTRHIDGVVLMNDAFVKEIGDLDDLTEQQISLAIEQKLQGQTLFDFNDPDEPSEKDHENAEQFKSLCESILEIGKANLNVLWTRKTLIDKSIEVRFGQFSRTKHRQAIQELADKSVASRIVPINAKQSKLGKWTLNDNTELRFDLDSG